MDTFVLFRDVNNSDGLNNFIDTCRTSSDFISLLSCCNSVVWKSWVIDGIPGRPWLHDMLMKSKPSGFGFWVRIKSVLKGFIF